ncbi:MAG TPA: thermonuclease family protein [Stellaceae bacterium]|nr:thermonuclease family protein [Stellaceae bacterium]
MHRSLIALRAVALALLLFASPARAAAPAPDFAPAGTARVAAVESDATLDLADGRKLRLAGIDLPSRGALARQARDALSDLVLRKDIELRSAGAPRDRQGRVLAHIFVGPIWIEGELLRRGLALVHGTADTRLGVAAMLRLERQARRYRRGLWADPAYAIIEAADAGKFAGSFRLVTGTVSEAAKTSRGIVLRFGPEGSAALAALIDARALKLCQEAGLDPLGLQGKRLLLRGFIDGTRRPLLAITHPEQIEILRAKKTAPAKPPGP